MVRAAQGFGLVESRWSCWCHSPSTHLLVILFMIWFRVYFILFSVFNYFIFTFCIMFKGYQCQWQSYFLIIFSISSLTGSSNSHRRRRMRRPIRHTRSVEAPGISVLLPWSLHLSHNYCRSSVILVFWSDRTLELAERPYLNYAFPYMESPQGGSERDKPPDSSSSTSPVSVVSSFWKGNSLIVNRVLSQFLCLLA